MAISTRPPHDPFEALSRGEFQILDFIARRGACGTAKMYRNGLDSRTVRSHPLGKPRPRHGTLEERGFVRKAKGRDPRSKGEYYLTGIGLLLLTYNSIRVFSDLVDKPATVNEGILARIQRELGEKSTASLALHVNLLALILDFIATIAPGFWFLRQVSEADADLVVGRWLVALERMELSVGDGEGFLRDKNPWEFSDPQVLSHWLKGSVITFYTLYGVIGAESIQEDLRRGMDADTVSLLWEELLEMNYWEKSIWFLRNDHAFAVEHCSEPPS